MWRSPWSSGQCLQLSYTYASGEGEISKQPFAKVSPRVLFYDEMLPGEFPILFSFHNLCLHMYVQDEISNKIFTSVT